MGIQSLLDEPNNQDPAQEEPFKAYKHNKAEYEQKVKAYDAKRRQDMLDRMQRQRNEVLMEAYRSELRRAKNSKKVLQYASWDGFKG